MIKSRPQFTPRQVVTATMLMLALTAAALVTFNRATAWNPLRAKNSAVEAGNRAMSHGAFKRALSHYDKAAKSLPESPGIQLNRGLALRSAKDDSLAQQAFTAATELRGKRSIRAEASYNLGIGDYQQGDALMAKQAFGDAQKAFKQAAEAFKQALRLSPGHKHAAWNLELALRQLDNARQQQLKQQDQEQQKQPDKAEDKGDEKKPSSDQAANAAQAPPQPPPQTKPDAPKPPSPADDAKPSQPVLPSDVESVLDTLQQREENLERHKARIRALQDNRRPAKDW